MQTETLQADTLQIDALQAATLQTDASPRETRIIEIVCEHLEIEPDEISETDLFVADHGADSLMLIGVLAALEKEFKITIDQAELTRMVSIAGVQEVVAQSIPQSSTQISPQITPQHAPQSSGW